MICVVWELSGRFRGGYIEIDLTSEAPGAYDLDDAGNWPMAGTDATEDRDKVASHRLAQLRANGKKLDLILETMARQGERLSRVERSVDQARRDISEVKSDIALLENKFLSTQTEILSILHGSSGGISGR